MDPPPQTHGQSTPKEDGNRKAHCGRPFAHLPILFSLFSLETPQALGVSHGDLCGPQSFTDWLVETQVVGLEVRIYLNQERNSF